MVERSATVDDVLNVLKKGMVSPAARWNEPFGNWTYVMAGRDCDGVPLAVAVAPDAAICRLTVLTVMDTER